MFALRACAHALSVCRSGAAAARTYLRKSWHLRSPRQRAMGRFIRIVGKDHREPQDQAHGLEARDKAWREALRIKTAGREASELSICLQHRRMADACVEEFCAWFEKQVGMLTRRGITAHIAAIDLSNNQIADRGLACIASTLGKLSPKSFRVLKLHHNRIKDVCAPLLEIIAWGKLGELHLSHNDLSPKSIYEIVVAAASAKDGAGNHRYPRSGTSPLWLRIEGNRQNAAASEKLAVDITEALCSIRRPLWRSICVVDGTTQCAPSRCCAKVNAPPAMHLTYMDFGQEKRFSVPTTETFKSPAPCYYQTKAYWRMDAKESIFRNSGAAIFGRNKTDILD